MKNPEEKLQTLFNIDLGPMDKTKLTLDEVKAELIKLTDVENKTGFLYFLIEYVKVSHPSRGAVFLKEELYKWQWDAAREFINYKQVVSLKSRQIGYSTIVAAYALWRALFYKAQEIAIVSLTQRDSIKFLDRIKFIYDHLPAWMQTETSEWAKMSVTFADSHSSIASLPNTDDPARGGSLSLLIVDEFAAKGFMKNQSAFLAAAGPAVSAGILDPFTNKSLPSQFFIISTLPENPINNEYLRILHQAQNNTDSEFHLIDADTSDIPHYQSEKWHKMMREALGERLYKIEILKQEVYDLEEALIPPHILEKIAECQENPIRVDFLLPDDVDAEGYYKDFDKMILMKDSFDESYNYIKGFWVWEDPQPGVQYIATCDTATGKANDYSAIEIFNLETLTQVAEYKGKVDLETFKKIIETICLYYNEAKLSIESTGLGQGIVDYFSETLNYENLYWHQKSKNRINPGFPMSASVRANGIAIFASLMTKLDLTVKSVRLINEIRAFGYKPNGRVEGIGSNDDLVMCLVQLCYLNNIGWAASDNMIQSHLVFGQLISDIDKKEKEKEDPRKSKMSKYFEERFDVELDEESKAFLEMAEASGASIPLDMMKLLKD